MHTTLLQTARSTALLGLLAIGALSATAQQSSPAMLRQHSHVRARYDQAAWPRGGALSYVPRELELTGWVGGALRCDEGLIARAYRRPDRGRPSFVLETLVLDSVEAAQDQLVSRLASATSPRLVRDGAGIGDAGFTAGETGSAWVLFVRNNVAVSLKASDPSGDPGLDLAAVAQAVDQAIRPIPVLDGAIPAKPKVETLALSRRTAVAGAILPIEIVARDPAGGRVHASWIVGGPGQGYVEATQDGAWLLHTTGPGTLRLILEATSSMGTWTRREITLDVLDD